MVAVWKTLWWRSPRIIWSSLVSEKRWLQSTTQDFDDTLHDPRCIRSIWSRCVFTTDNPPDSRFEQRVFQTWQRWWYFVSNSNFTHLNPFFRIISWSLYWASPYHSRRSANRTRSPKDHKSFNDLFNFGENRKSKLQVGFQFIGESEPFLHQEDKFWNRWTSPRWHQLQYTPQLLHLRRFMNLKKTSGVWRWSTECETNTQYNHDKYMFNTLNEWVRWRKNETYDMTSRRLTTFKV